MYQLLLVDDEYSIRKGIANLIAWNNHDVEIAGEAKNGREALELIPQLNPDIVITDIYMDQMNGLDLTEKINELYPEIKVIILSGYDEFEYAKKAIELNVFSYVLKPVLPEELLDIIMKAIQELNEDRKIKNKIHMLEQEMLSSINILQERFLIELIEGRAASEEEITQRAGFLGLELNGPCNGALIFSVDGYYESIAGKSPKETEIFISGLRNIINEVLNKYFKAYTLHQEAGSLVTVVSGLPDSGRKSIEALYTAIEKAKENIRNIMKVTVTASVGRFYGSNENIRKSFVEAERAMDYKFVTGKDSIINMDDIYSISGNSSIYPIDEERKILDHLSDKDEERLQAGFNAFFKSISDQNYSKDRLRISFMQLFAVIARKFMDLGIDIYSIYDKNLIDPFRALERYDTLEQLKNWIANITREASRMLRKGQEKNITSVIKKAQEYLAQNYSNPDISLITIAEHLYLSPAYFSKLYKKETGISYVEFITNLRIEEAKRLLKNSNARTSDIGNAVGYPNNQYFCTLFKKYTGISPVEYRES